MTMILGGKVGGLLCEERKCALLYDDTFSLINFLIRTCKEMYNELCSLGENLRYLSDGQPSVETSCYN